MVATTTVHIGLMIMILIGLLVLGAAGIVGIYLLMRRK
jgi:hypothetical protein